MPQKGCRPFLGGCEDRGMPVADHPWFLGLFGFLGFDVAPISRVIKGTGSVTYACCRGLQSVTPHVDGKLKYSLHNVNMVAQWHVDETANPEWVCLKVRRPLPGCFLLVSFLDICGLCRGNLGKLR